MGKTYEALQWAEKESQEKSRQPSPEFLVAGREEPPLPTSFRPVSVGYEELRINLLSRFPDGSIRTILFTGFAHGGGTSTTAINIAAALARDSALRVLLIDANFRTPSIHAVFKIDPAQDLSDLLTGNSHQGPIKVGPGNLHVIPCNGRHSDPAILFDSDGFDRFLKKVRETYDYIIFDGAPVQRFPEVRVLCAKVDGVVLVVESGKTHRRLALSVKKQLEGAGGKILGVVLNRRKFYIPEFIYRWL